MTQEKTNCLIEGCTAVSKSRGLCVHHYAIALGRVRAQTGTWKQFEILGIALPSTSPKNTERVDQFDRMLADRVSKAQ